MTQGHQSQTNSLAPKPWATVLFFAGLAVFYVIFLGRKPGRFQFDWVVDFMPEFYTHASNLTLSYVLVAALGFIGLTAGAGRRLIAVLTTALVAANLVVESVISVLNVPDWNDAWFGIAGALIGGLVLLVIHRWGLRPRTVAR